MRRSVTLFVLWLLVLSMIPAVVMVQQPRSASAQSIHWVYMPWVSHVGTTNGAGPWYGKISIQNLSTEHCAVAIWAGGSNGWSRQAQLWLRGGSSRSISSASLALPRPGAPVKVESACPIAAGVKEVTPDSAASTWSDGAEIVTGYAAIADADLQASRANANSGWFLPIIQTNHNWNTIIRIANFSNSTPASVTVRFFPNNNQLGADGVVRTVTASIPPAGHIGIDSLAEVGEFEWVGYASVSTTGSVGVLAHRSKPSTLMALTNVGVAADLSNGVTVKPLSAPLLFSGYNGWNTGINIANVSDSTAEVTVRYFETGGGFVREETLTMQPRSMEYIYTPHTVSQEEFVGSATIISNAPVVVAIDEVKYETIEAMSYMASPVGQTAAALPLVFRENSSGNRHDNSGINIANLNPNAPQAVEIILYSDVGDPILPQPIVVTLPAGGNDFIYLPFIDAVPPGTVASARLFSNDPMGFVAVSNNVNYAVHGDGSVVFGATSVVGLYRLN